MLKIIAGEARGRKLKTLKEDDLSIRPLLGRVKQSLFDMLQSRVPGASFLDLFAGVGSVGIEALSRGARRAVFVELSPRSARLIEENLAMLGWANRASLRKADVTKGLAWLNERFDLVFMGPPYVDDKKRPLALTSPALKAVAEAGILLPGGWLVSQHHEREPVIVPPGLERFRQEQYGETVIDFYRLSAGESNDHE